MSKEQQPEIMRQCIDAVLEANQEQILELTQSHTEEMTLAKYASELSDVQFSSKIKYLKELTYLSYLLQCPTLFADEEAIIPIGHQGQIVEYKQAPLLYQGKIIGYVFIEQFDKATLGTNDVKVIIKPNIDVLQAFSDLPLDKQDAHLADLVIQLTEILESNSLSDVALSIYGEQQAGYIAQGLTSHLTEASLHSEVEEEASGLDEINEINLIIKDAPPAPTSWCEKASQYAQDLLFIGLKFSTTILNSDVHSVKGTNSQYVLTNPEHTQLSVGLISKDKQTLTDRINDYFISALPKFKALDAIIKATKEKIERLPIELNQQKLQDEQKLKALKVSRQNKVQQLQNLLKVDSSLTKKWYESLFSSWPFSVSKQEKKQRLKQAIKSIDNQLSDLLAQHLEQEQASNFVMETICEKLALIKTQVADLDSWERSLESDLSYYPSYSIKDCLDNFSSQTVEVLKGKLAQEYLQWFLSGQVLSDAPDELLLRAKYLKKHHSSTQSLADIPFIAYAVLTRYKAFDQYLKELSEQSLEKEVNVASEQPYLPFLLNHIPKELDNHPMGMQEMNLEKLQPDDILNLYMPDEEFLPSYDARPGDAKNVDDFLGTHVGEGEFFEEYDYEESDKSHTYDALQERLKEYIIEPDKTYRKFTHVEYVAHDMSQYQLQDGDVVPFLQDNGYVKDYEIIKVHEGRNIQAYAFQPVDEVKGEKIELPILFVSKHNDAHDPISQPRILKRFKNEQKSLVKSLNRIVRDLSISQGKPVKMNLYGYGYASCYAQYMIWAILRAITQNAINDGYFNILELPENMIAALRSFSSNSIISDLRIDTLAEVNLLSKCPSSVVAENHMQSNICLLWLKQLFGKRIKFNSYYLLAKGSEYFKSGKTFIFSTDIPKQNMNIQALLFKEYTSRQSFYADQDFQFSSTVPFSKSLDERSFLISNQTPSGMDKLKKVFEEKHFDFEIPDTSIRNFF